jgi:hypothetical protein
MLCAVRRWYPTLPMVLLVDGGDAALKLGWRCRHLAVPVTLVARLRLDAALYDPPPPPDPHRKGRKPQKGKRQPSLTQQAADPQAAWTLVELPWYGGTRRRVQLLSDTALWYRAGYAPLPIRWVVVRDAQGELADQAFLCTDLQAAPEQIVRWAVLRWNIEVTFEEGRAHLGVETQRQWSDKAIERTTPLLFGLFSLVTLLAAECAHGQSLPIRQAAWYHKDEATFADALAFVRRQIWQHWYFANSRLAADSVLKFPADATQLLDALCGSN